MRQNGRNYLHKLLIFDFNATNIQDKVQNFFFQSKMQAKKYTFLQDSSLKSFAEQTLKFQKDEFTLIQVSN